MLHRYSPCRWSITPIALAIAVFVGCANGDAETTGESFGHDPNPPPAAGGGGVPPAQPGGGSSGGGGVGPGAAVQLIGRFDTRDPTGPKCGWPGCRVVAQFAGTRVSVWLREQLAPWMDGGPSEWDVLVDGIPQAKIVTNAAGGAQEYVISESLAQGAHVVELYKRSDANNGTTQFLAFDFGDGKALPPPARKARRLEIIGDSVASGYGVEGVGLGPLCPGPGYAAKYQNFHVSMGARLGEIFGAEIAGTVFGGKGISKNEWTPDKETMPKIYARTLPDDPTSAWDFSGFVAEVVVIMLGGNDFAIGLPVNEGPATLAQFTSDYSAFVATLRLKYPNAHIFLTVPPPLTDVEPPGMNTRTNVVAGVQAVTAQRNAAGDARVYAFEPNPGDGTEHTGCEGHGNAQFHQRVAGEIAAQIKAKVGWN